MIDARPWPHPSELPLVLELLLLPDPWQAAKKLANLKGLLFLDSAAAHPRLGRYSFVMADPFAWIEADGGPGQSPDPLGKLDAELSAWTAASVEGLPPFQGGAAGLFGYELNRYLERVPIARHFLNKPPDMAVGLYDWVLAWDHEAGRAWLVSTGFPERCQAARLDRARDRACGVLRLLSQAPASRILETLPPHTDEPAHPVAGLAGLMSTLDGDGYLRAARRAIEFVHAGDCFQVNLAQRLSLAAPRVDALALYGCLRQHNPAPFAGYFDLGAWIIASASPECFVRCRAGSVETRPIKGTRPRGHGREEDQRLAQELAASSKDRAENIMIVDLLRNDLGRVCQYGSVRVESLCQLESYATVHHLVSVVRGCLRVGQSPVSLLRAAFPGGSVTGAPKIRAMEIIAELEATARGPYCGCLGYVGFDGSMDSSILIRTITIGNGLLQLPVGGGIVADSDPLREREETWHKAEGLLRALRAWQT